MEPAMGAITAMCIGPSIHSVIVGTARGFIVVFDLRFEFPVQMWRHYDSSPIVSLTVIDSRTIINHIKLPELAHPCKGPLVIISTQRSNEICAFDLTTGTCRVRFRNSIQKQQQIHYSHSNHNTSTPSTKKKGLFSIFHANKPNKLNLNAQSVAQSQPFKQHRNTFGASIAASSGNTQLGLKISQLPSVYPAALGQCPATRPFSLPSFEPSTVLTAERRKLSSSNLKQSSSHKQQTTGSQHKYAQTGLLKNDNKLNKRSKTIS
eukprot:135649_1